MDNNTHKGKTQNEYLQEFTNNATAVDVEVIDSKLDSMNRGKVGQMWETVISVYNFATDPNVPWAYKALAVGALTYLVSPIDATPDILPLFGLVDDALVIASTAATLRIASRSKDEETPE